MSSPSKDLAQERWSAIIDRVREQTPARLLHGRSGGAYLTSTQLELREDHARACDALREELSLDRHFSPAFLKRWSLMELSSEAASKEEFLRRPDLGRRLSDRARWELPGAGTRGADLQILVGDGLSVSAVAEQVPPLLPLLTDGASARGWKLGRILVVRHCRVGIINDIGELLRPNVVVLLIGERPGLATVSSLSAYMAFRPGPSHSDADRNLVSNIHARGVSSEEAAARILALADAMFHAQKSGFHLKEPPHTTAVKELP